MKYVILHYIFMAHLCNIKMSAITIRHKSSRETYDIDGFINQLLASRKFDELAEKVADKAAVRIMSIEAAPARLERFSEVKKMNKTIENTEKSYRDQPNRDYEKDDLLDNIKLRNDNTQDKQGMIDTQAVMMDENTSQSNNLRLKYKYLTRNAYEKKVFNDRGSEKGDQPKRNEISEEKFRDHDAKAEEHTHKDTSAKNQHSSSKHDFIDENSRWRHDTRGDDRADLDSSRQGKTQSKSRIDIDDDRKENSKKSHQREDQDVRRDTIEAQNSRPEFKSIVKNDELGQVDNSTEEEKVESSSVEDDNIKNIPSSEEVKKSEEEPAKSSSDENIAKTEKEEVSPGPLRTQDESEPDIDENKITSDNQQEGAAYGYVYRSEEQKDEKVDEEPKSEEQGTEEQKTEEQKAEAQETKEQESEEQRAKAQETKEQDSEEQNTQKQRDSSEEEKPTATYKPVVRREGNKLYTYVEAPEYQEYHEQMAKMLKEHPVNPADFL